MNTTPIGPVDQAAEQPEKSALVGTQVTGQFQKLRVDPNMHYVSTKTPLKLWQATALIILSIALLCIPMAIGLAFSQNYREMWNRVFSNKNVQPISDPLIKSNDEQTPVLPHDKAQRPDPAPAAHQKNFRFDDGVIDNEGKQPMARLAKELREAADPGEDADPAPEAQAAMDEEGKQLSDKELLAQIQPFPKVDKKPSLKPKKEEKDAGPRSNTPEEEINQAENDRWVARIHQSQEKKITEGLIAAINFIITNINPNVQLTAQAAHEQTEELFGVSPCRESDISFPRIIDNAPVRAAFLKSPLLTQALIHEYPPQKHALVAEHLSIVFSHSDFINPQDEVQRKCAFFEVTLEELQNDAKALEYLKKNAHLQSLIPVEKNSPHIAAAPPRAPKTVFEIVQELFGSPEMRRRLGSNSAEIHEKVSAQLSKAGVSFSEIVADRRSKELFAKSSVLIHALCQAFPEQKNAFAAEYIFLRKNELYNKAFDLRKWVENTFSILKYLEVDPQEFFKDPAIVPYFTQSARLLLILNCIQWWNERPQDATEEQEGKKAGIDVARQAQADAEKGRGGALTQAGLSREILKLTDEEQKKMIRALQLKHHSDKGGDAEHFKKVANVMEMRKAKALGKYYSLLEELENKG
jgi:hypothetical protein